MRKVFPISFLICLLAICIPGMIFSHSFLGKTKPNYHIGFEGTPLLHEPQLSLQPLITHNYGGNVPLLSLNPAFHYTATYFNLNTVNISSLFGGEMLRLNMNLTFRSGNTTLMLPGRLYLPLQPGNIFTSPQQMLNAPKN